MDEEIPVNSTKISGYLHKKGRMRMVWSWKKYWFVLEGRLLLYYRSKDEYEAISPCKGSINMGPPCYVKLCSSVNYAFQIETRSNTITLKAEDCNDQKRWMQALMKALNQNNSTITDHSGKLNHFRYSLDDLIPKIEANEVERKESHKLHRQNTFPNKLATNRQSLKSNKLIIERLQKIGAQTYCGSLNSINKIAGSKTIGQKLLKDKEKTSKNSLKSSNHSINNENLMIENDQYLKIERNSTNNDSNKEDELVLRRKNMSEAVYERIPSYDSSKSRLKSYMVDNDNYSIPIKKTIYLNDKPINFLSNNRQTKSFIMENDNYLRTCPSAMVKMRNTKSDESLNLSSEIIDHNKNKFIICENFYNEINGENPYAIPLQTNNNEPVYAELKDLDFDTTKNKKGKTVKQSKSFLRKVLKKRYKKRDSNKEIEMEEKSVSHSHEGKNKSNVTDEKAIEMITKLQSVLESKKPLLKKELMKDEKIVLEKKCETSASITETNCPEIPPKTLTINNKNSEQSILYENISIQNTTIKSIDEILDDLNNSSSIQNEKNKSKVKQLIEKFNEEDVVVLRNPNKSINNERHSSDELMQLLNQLSEVTSAPILTPGVTSSLINSSLTDDELLKLLPIRQRRLSDPDYDVPRPHKSIQLMLQNKEESNKEKDVIEGTRFFGPALPPSSANDSGKGEHETVEKEVSNELTFTFSMTPDSLELFHDTNRRNSSSEFTNHHNCLNNDYLMNLKHFCHNRQEEVIYAQPKPFNAISVVSNIVGISQNTIYDDSRRNKEEFSEDTIIYKNVKNIDLMDDKDNDEVFHDSLEIFNETSTAF